MYLSYLVDECVPCTSFYGVLCVSDHTSKSIFSLIICELKESKFDLSQFVAFCLDGDSCFAMVGRENGVAYL